MATAIMAALLIGVIVFAFGALTTLGSSSVVKTISVAGAVAAFFTAINVAVFYWLTPTVGLSGATYWFSWWWIFLEVLVAIGFVSIFAGTSASSSDYYGLSSSRFSAAFGSFIALGLALVMLVLVPVFAGTWSDSRAKKQAHRIVMVDESKTGINNYPDTDPDHIVLLSADMADFKAQNAMNQVNSAGAGNISTLFELGQPVLESVAGHAYYLMDIHPSGYRNSGSVNGTVPGYMQVDAENPDAPAKFITTSSDGKPLALKYYPGGWFAHNLNRHVWTEYHAQITNDPTLEVDDQGKPYYTLSLDQLTLNNSSTVPKALLVVDAQTGEIKSYPLGQIPDWVDRVYSSDTVKTMLNWWGKWANAPYSLNESSAGRYHLPEGEDPTLVYTKGGHPVLQAILTSMNKDTSASYLVLADARDNQAKLYQIPNLTLESVAATTIVGSGRNLKHQQPVHMALHRIYGVLTWVSPLESGDNHAYQGMAMVRADDVNGSSVVLADNKADALNRYRETLARGTSSNAGPQANSDVKTVDGTVADVTQVVEGANGQANTAYYFLLEGDTTHSYHALIDTQHPNPELPFVKAGKKIRLSYFDTGAVVRDVGSYDDLGLALSSK